jgi:predicted phage terminase large subunit-like protein
MRQTAQMDATRYNNAVQIVIEQEPGSSGVDAMNALIKLLAGFPVKADRPTGDKDVRLEPFAAQCEAGNVKLVRAAWNGAYIDEMTAIPNGKYRDQGDASSGAFNHLQARDSAGTLSYV